MQYNVTVTFRNGATRTKDFDKMEKADRYFNRYNTMLPNPRQPTTQVASVRIEIRDIDGRWAGIRDTDGRTGSWYGHLGEVLKHLHLHQSASGHEKGALRRLDATRL